MQLAEVLPLCTSATKLDLQHNGNISDRGAKALAAAFAEGAMPSSRDSTSRQPDWRRGRGGLAEAVGKGALPRARGTLPHENQIGDEGAVALAEAVGKGALPELKVLELFGFIKLSQTAKDAWEAVKAKRRGLRVDL